MRVRSTARRALLGSAVALAAAGWMADAAAQDRKFSFAYDQPPTTAYGIAANIFDTKLKELSGGKMSINQFPGGQLGRWDTVKAAIDQLAQVGVGEAQLALAGQAGRGDLDQPLALDQRGQRGAPRLRWPRQRGAREGRLCRRAPHQRHPQRAGRGQRTLLDAAGPLSLPGAPSWLAQRLPSGGHPSERAHGPWPSRPDRPGASDRAARGRAGGAPPPSWRRRAGRPGCGTWPPWPQKPPGSPAPRWTGRPL